MFWQFALTTVNIRRNSNVLLIFDCGIDKHDHSIDIIFRFREFRRRFAIWEKYFVLMTNVFDSRKTARFKLFNLWTKKRQEIFFAFKYVFSKLLCFVYDWLVKWICSFILFRTTKKMKRLSFSKINDDWLWFDFLTSFYFFIFVIFLFFFNFRIICTFKFFEKSIKSRYCRFFVESHFFFFLFIFFRFRVDTLIIFF